MFKTENVPESTTLPAVDNNNLFDAVASPLADPLCDDIAGNSLPFDNSIDLDNWRNPEAQSGLNSFELNDFFITS